MIVIIYETATRNVSSAGRVNTSPESSWESLVKAGQDIVYLDKAELPNPKSQRLNSALDDYEDSIEAVKAEKIHFVRLDARATIIAKYSDWMQRNADAGYYGDTFKATMDIEITSVISESNTFESDIDALATVAEVNAYTYTFTAI